MATIRNIISTEDKFLVKRPRSTNEIPINSETIGSMPNNEKDASQFPLATTNSIIFALKSLYKNIDENLFLTLFSK